MRISSISVAQPAKFNNVVRSKNVQNPNFQGKGGAFGTLLGAGIGLALTAATGGALFWTVPLISGSCGIGGDMFEKKNQPASAEDQYDWLY